MSVPSLSIFPRLPFSLLFREAYVLESPFGVNLLFEFPPFLSMTSAFITLSSGARGDEVFNFLFFLVTLPRDLVLRRVLVDGDGECLDSKDWLLGSKGLERAFSDSKGVKVCCFEGWLGSEDSLLDSNDWRLDSEGERPDEDFLFTFVFFTSHPYVLTHLREQNL
eukprot:1228036-Amorphochlora_amoeboformis.AAC.1